MSRVAQLPNSALTPTLFYEDPSLVKSRVKISCGIFWIPAARVSMHTSRIPPPSHLVCGALCGIGGCQGGSPGGRGPHVLMGRDLDCTQFRIQSGVEVGGGNLLIAGGTPPSLFLSCYLPHGKSLSRRITSLPVGIPLAVPFFYASVSLHFAGDSPCGLSEGPCRLPYLPAGFKPKRVTSSPARTQDASGTFPGRRNTPVYSLIALPAASCRFVA